MKAEGTRGFVWLPAVLAAVAFAFVSVVFVREMRSFRQAVLEWAGNDLENRTKVAVRTLRRPLQAGDLSAVYAYNRQCVVDGIRLSVFGKPKGLVFDSLGGRRRDGVEDVLFLYGPILDAGDFEIRLGLPLDKVLAPFNRARWSFALAALVGMTGVLLFFFITYRQRVRIRELARLERFRREFIADVSHEIKTPLTGILGAVDMLDGEEPGTDDGRRKILLALLKKESVRLNGLVQSILDLARLEREGEVLNLAETDLGAMVGELVGEFKPRAESAGIALTVAEIPARTPVVRCDAQLVGQAVSNLIANAIRHSGSKDVVVSVGESGRTVRIVVEDHGVGIPPEHAAQIFERFHRVDPARAAETGGAGLGLAIVRRIARLHGGDVAYAPAEPHGSRFTLTVSRNLR